jgi:hypothetical protein
MVMQIVTWAILPARRSRAAGAWTFRVLGRANLRTSSPDERIGPDRTGSAKDMEHEFTIPARVVEVTQAPQEIDPDTGELLPPAPAATDDGTPIAPPAEPDDDRPR